MRRNNSLLGLVGIILLLFAGIAGVLTRAATAVDVLYIAANGVLGLFALIAYLSAGLEQLRTVVSERSTKYGVNVLVGSLAFLAALALVNYLSIRHHRRFDLTEQGVFSLSPQSTSVVKALQQDLNIQAFVEGGVNPELRDLFESYTYASNKVKYQMIDPDKQPELAEKFRISTYNTVRLEYGQESTTITQPTEETVTNAIIKVTRPTRKMICFIEGHGEPEIDEASTAQGQSDPRAMSSLKQALLNENYDVKKVLLASMPSVPDDCAAVIAVSTEKHYLDGEVKALQGYVDGGGRLLLLVAPREGAEFAPLLAAYGVRLGDDLVVDQLVRLFEGPSLGLSPLVNTYTPHEITRDFRQRTVFPMTRSVHAETDGKTGIQAIELVKTAPSSWAETDLDRIFNSSEAALDDNDTKGPVPIAVVATADLKQMGRDKEGTVRLAVYGSVDFALNREVDGTYFNRDLLMNTVGWLVGQSDLLSIRPRDIRASRVQFTAEQSTVIFYLTVLLIPQLLLIAGLAVWWRRE